MHLVGYYRKFHMPIWVTNAMCNSVSLQVTSRKPALSLMRCLLLVKSSSGNKEVHESIAVKTDAVVNKVWQYHKNTLRSPLHATPHTATRGITRG